MNEQNNKTVNFKDRRRYKYGSLSVVFTVVFIVLVLVINLVFSSLSLSGNLTVDLTQEEFTSVGEESQKLLDDLGKDLDITLYFMMARDKFENSSFEIQGINYLSIVRDLAENYANIYDGSGDKGTIRVEYKELDEDPEFEKKYYEESTTALSEYSLIVQGKHHFRIINIASFYTLGEDGTSFTAFNGEYRMTSAIIQSSIEEAQVVALTYGHNEADINEGIIAAGTATAGIATVLENAGYEVQTVNLAFEELDPRTEIVITYDPTKDFSDAEVDKLTKYLAERNAFMVFVDSATPELENLQDCLNDNWGINYKPFNRVADDTHSLNNSTSNINAKFPVISDDLKDVSAAYQIVKTVADGAGTVNTMLPESVELFIKDGITQDGFTVETVLTTYDTAISTPQTGEGNSGEMPLMLLSTKHGYGENNVYEYSYVMLIGSTEFANYLNTESYGNKQIFLSAVRNFAVNRVAPDIQAKQFGSTALDIETGTARTLTWLICTIVPGALIIMGIVVFFKRRHM